MIHLTPGQFEKSMCIDDLGKSFKTNIEKGEAPLKRIIFERSPEKEYIGTAKIFNYSTK